MEIVLRWVIGALAVLAAGLVVAGLAAQAPPAPEAAEPKAQPRPSGADGVRLWQYVRGDTPEFFDYGLKVVPPWRGRRAPVHQLPRAPRVHAGHARHPALQRQGREGTLGGRRTTA